MARYRKIDVRMRSDAKFRALSAPPPNGQDCWIYLLTNRYTSNIPGLYAAFAETLARDLGWPLEGFLDAFREASEKGMAQADWEAGLVFIPNAIAYEPPQSINVIKSWQLVIDELPECDLKHEALHEIAGFVDGMSEGFRDAFAKLSVKPCRIQEQEQEQEQEEITPPRASGLSDVEVVTATWRSLTGNLVQSASAMLEVCQLVVEAAKLDGQGVAAAASKYIGAFVAWVDDCPPGRRPQKAPHKFVANFAAVQEWARGERKAEAPAESPSKKSRYQEPATFTQTGKVNLDD